MSAKDQVAKPGSIRERNERKILDAAEQEFVQHGYKGTSTQAIANRAELPKANVLYYFKSKEKLYIAVLAKIMKLWDGLLEEPGADDDPAEVLERFIRGKVAMSMEQPRASKLFAMEIIQGAPHIRDYIESDMRAWVETKAARLQGWMDAGKMDEVDPEQLIFMIWATTQHYADFDAQVMLLMGRSHFTAEDKERICRAVCEVILKGCGLIPSHLRAELKSDTSQ